MAIENFFPFPPGSADPADNPENSDGDHAAGVSERMVTAAAVAAAVTVVALIAVLMGMAGP